MKILVYPHDLGMGGSQLNAIELAAAVRDLGHEVWIYGRHGILNERIAALGLDFIESPRPRIRPTCRVVAHLRSTVRRHRFDVVHGYEWPPILEAELATLGVGSVAMGTVMSMAVAPFLPRRTHLVVGTRQIAAEERARGRSNVHVIEPPVDLTLNNPKTVTDVDEFRLAFGIPDGLHVVVVSRLANELKLEGLLTAIERCPQLSPETVLTIVGDGPARERVAEAAEAANLRAGRRAVVLTGQVKDPRPAYAMADIALGMGGSALRAMAFGAPLVVQGEHGFWKSLSPESIDSFRWAGWYGIGAGRSEGAARFDDAVRPLVEDVYLREQRGRFAQHIVANEYSLRAAAVSQERIYRSAIAAGTTLGTRLRAVDLSAASRFVGFQTMQMGLTLLGRAPQEDFNSKPTGFGRQTSSSRQRPLVYLAGSAYDEVEGTDRRLVEALSRDRDVVWVDPPKPVTAAVRDPALRARLRQPLTQETASVVRLHTWGPPGLTRRGVRRYAARLHSHAVNRAIGRMGDGATPTVVMAGWLSELSLVRAFPRAMYLTDDAEAGARLLGVDGGFLASNQHRQAMAADEIFVVSQDLADLVAQWGRSAHLVPNGAAVDHLATWSRPYPTSLSAPVAGLVGQLNDRLDLRLLVDLARTGVSLLVVGPRRERDAAIRDALDELFSFDNVEYVGPVPYADIPSYLAATTMGLTPYTDSAFNRASFPLKTLEYLAAGRRVVSTDLPSSRWLNTPLVDVAATPEEFIRLVHRRLSEPVGPGVEESCRAVAQSHSWQVRAAAFDAALRGNRSPERHITRELLKEGS